MHIGLALALISLVCYLANAALFLALHLRASGYSPVKHAVSDYGVGPTRRAFAVYSWLGSAGGLALAATLWMKGPPVPAWLVGVLLVMVAARVGVVLLPTDLEGQRLTRAGLLHYAFAVLSFAAAYVFMRDATAWLTRAPGWEIVAPVLRALAWAALPALVGNCVTLLPPLRRVFGIFERIFIGVAVLWFVTASCAVAFAR